ncbi:MAG TPA: CoA-transferase [Methylomirabilota bacterium]
MPETKLMSMREAVSRFVPDGSVVCLGTALEAAIPFTAGHELIRQRRRNLTLIGPISDILFDQLVGAGCVARIVAAWVGNVSAGLGHNYRRACEQGIPASLAVEDHTNLTLAVALLAGAIGAPYIPTRSLLGTGLLESNPGFRPAEDPWSGRPVVLVPALTPEVAILHVQRADAAGHAHAWGTLGVTRDAALAARRVIVVAEEIRTTEEILSDPNLVLAPPMKVAAVVHEPYGAFPSPLQGFYARDHEFYHRYHEESRTVEGFRAWLERWVLGVKDGEGFRSRLGAERLEAVRVKTPAPALAVDLGA